MSSAPRDPRDPEDPSLNDSSLNDSRLKALGLKHLSLKEPRSRDPQGSSEPRDSREPRVSRDSSQPRKPRVLSAGDRVRVTKSPSPYTGCRGVVVEVSGPDADGGAPLGYYVAIDGENGLRRPFLAGDLEAVTALKVRPNTGVANRASG